MWRCSRCGPCPRPVGAPRRCNIFLLAQEMLQDEDEGTADAVKAKLDTYAEVSPPPFFRAVRRMLIVCVRARAQWAEYRDMKHDLFVPQGGEVLLLESGASAETLLLEN